MNEAHDIRSMRLSGLTFQQIGASYGRSDTWAFRKLNGFDACAGEYRYVAEPGQRMTTIAAAVCDAYEISITDLLGPSRVRRFAWPRQHAMYLMRQTGRFSFPQIGRFFRRDHSTVMAAVRAYAERNA